MSHLMSLMINSGQCFCLNRSAPLLLYHCLVPASGLHTTVFGVQAGRLAFSSPPDQFEDLSPVLRKSALTKLSSSWPAGLAWAPGPIPSGAQAAAFPIEGGGLVGFHGMGSQNRVDVPKLLFEESNVALRRSPRATHRHNCLVTSSSLGKKRD